MTKRRIGRIFGIAVAVLLFLCAAVPAAGTTGSVDYIGTQTTSLPAGIGVMDILYLVLAGVIAFAFIGFLVARSRRRKKYN